MALTGANSTRPCAMYLRCYPQDIWQMQTHQQALRDYAAHLGLPEPALYLDNGVSSHGDAPQRDILTEAVARGFLRYVLVPGPWVFHLDPRRARRIAQNIVTAGGQILELPAQRDYLKADALSYEQLPATGRHLRAAVR
ncbi:hypothetical protein ACFV4M_04990 [Kitasatospora indigofera]|uniref:hypothetical protein n=1 Tax=Kitasatospora indigofera TaxID=67307 RepID=UPI0036255176